MDSNKCKKKIGVLRIDVTIEDLVKMENVAKMLRSMVSVNAQILKAYIEDEPPVLSMYLRKFQALCNEQAAVVTWLTETVNRQLMNLLRESK